MGRPQNVVKEIIVYKGLLGWMAVWVWVLGQHLVRYQGPSETEALRIAKEDGEACNLPVIGLDGKPL